MYYISRIIKSSFFLFCAFCDLSALAVYSRITFPHLKHLNQDKVEESKSVLKGIQKFTSSGGEPVASIKINIV